MNHLLSNPRVKWRFCNRCVAVVESVPDPDCGWICSRCEPLEFEQNLVEPTLKLTSRPRE